jgi:hypothetical protein
VVPVIFTYVDDLEQGLRRVAGRIFGAIHELAEEAVVPVHPAGG